MLQAGGVFSCGTESEISTGQVPLQQNSADERHHKLHREQRSGSEDKTPVHPPAAQRRNKQTGCAGQKPRADKVQPLQREEQTDSGKKEKAAHEEEWHNKTEDLPVTGVGGVMIAVGGVNRNARNFGSVQ